MKTLTMRSIIAAGALAAATVSAFGLRRAKGPAEDRQIPGSAWAVRARVARCAE
jgi:hypothetical protein